MSNGHGGKRKGAGRPKGARSRLTERAIERAGEGLLPLDYMLAVLRDENRSDAERMDAAKAAAPFVHARLAQIDQTVVHRQGVDEFDESELLDIARSGGDGVAGKAPRPSRSDPVH